MARGWYADRTRMVRERVHEWYLDGTRRLGAQQGNKKSNQEHFTYGNEWGAGAYIALALGLSLPLLFLVLAAIVEICFGWPAFNAFFYCGSEGLPSGIYFIPVCYGIWLRPDGGVVCALPLASFSENSG